jgi:hypothetical protein
MSSFDMKRWLDTNVVPLTQRSPQSRIYSFIWNGNPPKEILVWLLAGDEPVDDVPFNPHAWPELVKRLIVEDDFRFDYLREQQMVQLENGLVPVFGGDGAPLISKEGMASARLFRKMDDGIALILQVGCQYPPEGEMSAGQHASAAVKTFFGLFEDENPLTVCSKYGALFGQA